MDTFDQLVITTLCITVCDICHNILNMIMSGIYYIMQGTVFHYPSVIYSDIFCANYQSHNGL